MNENRGTPQDFLNLLAAFNLRILDSGPSSIYGLWPDLTLAYLNAGWRRFADQNGGEPAISSDWSLGCYVIDAISEPLKPYFIKHFRRCLREQRPWEHSYECSSARWQRQFHMTTYPLGDSEGLLVVHSLRREMAQTRSASDPVDALYRNDQGAIVQCSHCRRVRRAGPQEPASPAVWDWVPAWVNQQPPKTRHGLCELCFGFYYSQHHIGEQGFPPNFSEEC